MDNNFLRSMLEFHQSLSEKSNLFNDTFNSDFLDKEVSMLWNLIATVVGEPEDTSHLSTDDEDFHCRDWYIDFMFALGQGKISIDDALEVFSGRLLWDNDNEVLLTYEQVVQD